MEIDRRIIQCLVEHASFNAYWLNCNLHNAFDTYKDLTRNELNEILRSNNEFLFYFIIIYNFEREGFDAKVDKCRKNCDWYKTNPNKNKIKAHTVAVLKALYEIGGIEKIESSDIKSLAEKWMRTTYKVYKQIAPNKKINKRGINEKLFLSFLKFYKEGKIDKLRYDIKIGKFENAYNLIKEIEGIGNKIAKLIIRDLAFSLSNWAIRKEYPYQIKENELIYALPIDRWVRRVAISIPLIFKELYKNLQEDDFIKGNITLNINKKLSEVINKVCKNCGLNPLIFDHEAFRFGYYHLGEKWRRGGLSSRDIYEELKNILKFE